MDFGVLTKQLTPLYRFVLSTIFAFILLFGQTAAGQELVPADTLNGWDTGLVASLNGSQATYSNWSKGGVNNLSVVAGSQFDAFYRKNRFSYGLRIRTRYGQSRLQDEGVRKIDDRFSIRNQFLRALGDESVDFSLFANVNFETQFDNGYDYGAGTNGSDLLISRFMSPAYVSQNVGIAYIPGNNLEVEAGLGFKQTIVSDEALSTRYGLGPGQQLFNEAGLNLGVSYERSIMENLQYAGYVETFTNLNRHPDRTDIIFSNELVGRINDYLNMSFQFELIYDDDFSTEVQLSQVLSAGLSISIL